MKFFAYREQMKTCESAVFTGLDQHTRKFAAGRALLRKAHGLMAAGKREDAEKLVRDYAAGIPDAYLLPYCIHGTVPDEAGMESVHVPSAEEVLCLFKERGMENKHPRLLADETTFAEIRVHQEELPYKNWIDALKQRAATFMDAPFAPWVDAGDDLMTKKNYLDPCRVVKVRVQTLAMLYQITQEERYARRAKAEILNFITYPTYYPEHYLNVAEACYALCLGYDWLYDTFTPEERDAIWLAVKEKCFDTAKDNMTNCTGWAGVLNNWNQVCNGGIAIGALGMMERDPELCAHLVGCAVRNIPRSLADIGPDGCYPEGPTYWVYGTAYATYLMAALTSVLGQDFGLSGAEGYKETMSYLIYCTAPSGEPASYADTNTMGRGTPQALWMARLFDEPAYAGYALTRFPFGGTSEGGVYELLWYRGQPDTDPAQAGYPLDMVYDGHESLAFFRSAWNDPQSLYGFFKGGDNQSNHGCLDIGQFLLDRFGIRWACDLKGENYAVPDYWDRISGRWRYYRKRAEGHNTLLINPGKGPDQDIFAACSIDTFGAAPGAAFAACDLTEAYAPFGAEKIRRGFLVFDNRSKCLVQDEITCREPSTIWWRMHTRVQDIMTDGNRAILKQDGHTLTVTMQTPGASFFLMPAEPLIRRENTPDTPNEDVRVLCVKLENTRETVFRAVFTFDGCDELPEPMAIADFASFIQK